MGGGWGATRRVRRAWAPGEESTTRKQPADLAVAGAEESLSIPPGCTPTVRPPPKRCWHVLSGHAAAPFDVALSHCPRRVCVVSGVH